jgi:hypothetical protein
MTGLGAKFLNQPRTGARTIMMTPTMSTTALVMSWYWEFQSSFLVRQALGLEGGVEGDECVVLGMVLGMQTLEHTQMLWERRVEIRATGPAPICLFTRSRPDYR